MIMTPDRTRPEPPGRDAPTSDGSSAAAARRLRADFAAVRVSFTWFGVRKTLSSEQKAQAAEQFGAEGQYLSAAKKLLDTKHKAFQQLTALRSQIVSYWKGMSLPYPEPGVRLIRQEDVDPFHLRMGRLRGDLAEAVENLDAHFDQLRAAAADRLGRLYNPADYPPTLVGLFGVEFDFPSVEPPDYLRRLNPHLYEQERQRMRERFDEAVRRAEEAFVAEFAKLVGHLSERLTAGADGRRKVFRDTAVTHLTEFFDRFRALSVRSNPELDRLVETARQAVRGVAPNDVRGSDALRQQLASQLSAVGAALDGLLVDQPRRRILRPAPRTTQEQPSSSAREA